MFGLDGEWVQGVGGFGCVEGVGEVGVFEFGGESRGEEGGTFRIALLPSACIGIYAKIGRKTGANPWGGVYSIIDIG